jgi:hypothetical protein
MKRFIIPSLIAAGLISVNDAVALSPIDKDHSSDKEIESSILNYALSFKIAGHSSHRSHGSHRSSSGGSGTYRPPVAPSPGTSTTLGACCQNLRLSQAQPNIILF